MSALKNTQLAQVAIVVKDIEVSRARFAALFGVDPPPVIVTQPGQNVRLGYRGKASADQAKLAFFNIGEKIQLELIEPIGRDSAWAEDLDERGERVHHLAFWTEDMREAAQTFDEHGAPIIMRGDMGEGQYGYFDGVDKFGVMFELLEQKRTELS